MMLRRVEAMQIRVAELFRAMSERQARVHYFLWQFFAAETLLILLCLYVFIFYGGKHIVSKNFLITVESCYPTAAGHIR